jgi:hypothetical protein
LYHVTFYSILAVAVVAQQPTLREAQLVEGVTVLLDVEVAVAAVEPPQTPP